LQIRRRRNAQRLLRMRDERQCCDDEKENTTP
jgi:hypothetical protein